MNKLLKNVLWIVISASLLLLVLLMVLYFNQGKLIFFPEVLAKDFEFKFNGKFKEANLTLSTGESINYLIFNPDSSKGTILYFHGNAGSLKDWGYTASELAEKTGWSVWIVDYTGYGKSTGSIPKSEKVLLDIGRVFIEKISTENAQLPIVLFGRSLGSGIATAIAAEKKISGLVLETPYRSVAKLGHEIYPILPECFSRFDLSNEKWLPDIKVPILILHGTADRVIPYQHGEFVSELNHNTKLISIKNGAHNNLSDFIDYWPNVLSYFESIH